MRRLATLGHQASQHVEHFARPDRGCCLHSKALACVLMLVSLTSAHWHSGQTRSHTKSYVQTWFGLKAREQLAVAWPLRRLLGRRCGRESFSCCQRRCTRLWLTRAPSLLSTAQARRYPQAWMLARYLTQPPAQLYISPACAVAQTA